MSTALLSTSLAFGFAGGLLGLSTYITLRAGLLSFAPVSFAAAGGFIAAYGTANWGIGFVEALILGCLAGALFGLAFSPIARRLESHWLALATVALMLITRVVVVNVPEVTGGSMGMLVNFNPGLLEVAIVLALGCLFVARLEGSRFGTAAVAAREDPIVAGSIGVPVRRLHMVAFTVSGALGGAAGVLQAGLLQWIDPDTFYLMFAMAGIAAVVLGGAYHWSGAIIGAIVFTGIPNYVSQYISQGEAIASGLLLLAIMIWLPGGLIDPLRWHLFRERRARRAQKRAGDGSESEVPA